MQRTYSRIGVRIALILGVLILLLCAYFVRGEATGFTYATGTGQQRFELKIDSHALYNGVVQTASTWSLKNLSPYHDQFFKLDDVKPGDFGEATISFHVNKDAWVCLDFMNLKGKENGCNEPEGVADASCNASQGELVSGTEFFAWYDDGDDLFEQGEMPIFGTSTQSASSVLKNKTYALADSLNGNPFPASKTSYIGVAWCAGNLTVNVEEGTITCDGSVLGNEAQTDSFSVDVSFRSVPKKDNSNFTCKRTGHSCEWPKRGGPVRINIENNATVQNNITVYSNTGGNSGGTVTTGVAEAISSVRNLVNQNLFRR